MAIEKSTVGSILRCTQAYCQQISEKQTLDHGIAFYNSRFALLPEANQFREVVCDSAAMMPAVFDEADRFFAEHDLVCHRWAPVVDQSPELLADYLVSHGFTRRTSTAYVLTSWVDLPPADGVRVVHARAIRAALRGTFETHDPAVKSNVYDSDAARKLQADACDERLDEPQFDMFVALVDKLPAGRGALYQVGDIARVMDLTVLDSFAGRLVDRTLLGHLLALAKRLAIRNIVAQVDNAESEKRELFESAGFIPDGIITEFHRTARP